jgi:transposase
MLFPLAGGSGAVIKLGELVMILDLHRQGLSISAIARHLRIDRKTVRSAIAKGLEPPKYKHGRLGRGSPIRSSLI